MAACRRVLPVHAQAATASEAVYAARIRNISFPERPQAWLNQVERFFFSSITDKTIRCGSLSSVNDLITKVDHFVANTTAPVAPAHGPPPP